MKRVLVALLLVACGKSPAEQDLGMGGAEKSGVETSEAPSRESGPVMDFTGKKLVPTEVTVEGVTLTIDIPEGLPRDPKSQDWDDDRPAYDHAPKVFIRTIEKSRVQSLEKAKYHATLDARAKTWVREEQRDDGFAVTTIEPDKSKIEVATYRTANADRYMNCKASHSAGTAALPKLDATRKLLETICDSIKLK